MLALTCRQAVFDGQAEGVLLFGQRAIGLCRDERRQGVEMRFDPGASNVALDAQPPACRPGVAVRTKATEREWCGWRPRRLVLSGVSAGVITASINPGRADVRGNPRRPAERTRPKPAGGPGSGARTAVARHLACRGDAAEPRCAAAGGGAPPPPVVALGRSWRCCHPSSSCIHSYRK